MLLLYSCSVLFGRYVDEIKVSAWNVKIVISNLYFYWTYLVIWIQWDLKIHFKIFAFLCLYPIFISNSNFHFICLAYYIGYFKLKFDFCFYKKTTELKVLWNLNIPFSRTILLRLMFAELAKDGAWDTQRDLSLRV